MKVSLGGVIPILPTPFTAQGAIDEEGFARVADAAIGAGVDGVAMFGLASEYYVDLTTGGTGLTAKTPDTRIPM